MNIPIVNIYGHDGDGSEEARQGKVNYVLQVGTLSSALEHAVPEQMFVTPENPGEAISAVKALSKASAAGQRIYHITQANQASILPNIHHDSLVMNEISNALNTGKEVITHTDDVSVPGWSGAGYIIYGPVTGDGAYKIGGGANGGWLLVAAGVLLLLAAFFAPYAAIALPQILQLFFVGFASIFVGLSKLTTDPDKKIFACQIGFVGLIAAISSMLEFLKELASLFGFAIGIASVGNLEAICS